MWAFECADEQTLWALASLLQGTNAMNLRFYVTHEISFWSEK